MIKEMDFDFHISNISITLFGFKPKNQIKEKRENPSINLMKIGKFKYKVGNVKTIIFTKIVQ
ncbi:hypothetical protein [Photorhabdus luminescens]|uniref:hypothetical protein n=1 Tax=Photorhabdus luminescens TaxID=29488 RepID=UPI00223FB535|nr:hypothetical protein [Photorhabdus luminescens]MCW7763893.1 hypothetical protein [Photorhabdus luminescens subsp. venezuelensis]